MEEHIFRRGSCQWVATLECGDFPWFSQRFSHRCHSQKHCHFFCHKGTIHHHPLVDFNWWANDTARAWTNESRTMNECRKTLSCCLLSLLPPSVSICGPVSSNLGFIQSIDNMILYDYNLFNMDIIWYYMDLFNLFNNSITIWHYMTICSVWTFGQRGLIYMRLLSSLYSSFCGVIFVEVSNITFCSICITLAVTSCALWENSLASNMGRKNGSWRVQ